MNAMISESMILPSVARSGRGFRIEFEYVQRTLRRLGTDRSEVDDLAQEHFLGQIVHFRSVSAETTQRALDILELDAEAPAGARNTRKYHRFGYHRVHHLALSAKGRKDRRRR